jgi:hypothetical protein
MKFAMVGNSLKRTSGRGHQLLPDAFEGGFDVDGFWEYLFTDPSYRFVCSASSSFQHIFPAASFFTGLTSHIIKYLSTWRNLHFIRKFQVEDKLRRACCILCRAINLPYPKSLPGTRK